MGNGLFSFSLNKYERPHHKAMKLFFLIITDFVSALNSREDALIQKTRATKNYIKKKTKALTYITVQFAVHIGAMAYDRS